MPRGFRVKGHAEDGAKGSNLLCAAVSNLVQVTFITLSRDWQIEPVISKHDGYFQAELPSTMTAQQQVAVKTLLGNLHNGFALLAEKYPEEVEVSNNVDDQEPLNIAVTSG